MYTFYLSHCTCRPNIFWKHNFTMDQHYLMSLECLHCTVTMNGFELNQISEQFWTTRNTQIVNRKSTLWIVFYCSCKIHSHKLSLFTGFPSLSSVLYELCDWEPKHSHWCLTLGSWLLWNDKDSRPLQNIHLVNIELLAVKHFFKFFTLPQNLNINIGLVQQFQEENCSYVHWWFQELF